MHLQPILYFRERITELSEQAKFGPSHTILPHIKVAHCLIKNPAMKIAVRAADAGEITQDATSPVPALVKK